MASPLPETAQRTLHVDALLRIPGLLHGFEQRASPGVVIPPEDSRARLSRALAPFGRLHFLKQVHGAVVHEAPWQGRPEGDAGVAPERGLILGVETADCLPVLLVDPVRHAVAAAHAGWRGTAAGVTTAAVAALVLGGSAPGDLLAALGPANDACCYEVGPELRDAFAADWQEVARAGPRGRPHLDVRKANLLQLRRAGLLEGNIHDVAECTECHPERYHSYRREGKGGGRMISYVGWSL